MEKSVSYMKLVLGVAAFVCIKHMINCKMSYSLTLCKNICILYENKSPKNVTVDK